jgi:superfamily II DNA or RNA helicase
MELRPYQTECIDALPENGSALVQMATGLGKTVTFSQIPRKGRALILSHRQELVYQPQKYYNCSYGVEIGTERSNGEEVVAASVQSLVRRLDKFSPDAFDLIVTDEAHHVAASTYQKIYEHFKPRLHVGFTATPNRADNIRLDTVFSDIVFERDLRWGIENKYLCPINCLKVQIGYDLSNVAVRMGDYSPTELGKALDKKECHDAIADAYKRYAKGATLIFASSVKCCEEIASRIPGAVVVTGETKNRKEIIEAFCKREIPCLVNCMVFTEGTDIPLVETVMIARPTQSDALYTQMVGRGLRLHHDKEKLTLIDCVGVTSRLDLCTAPTLLGIDAQAASEGWKTEIEEDLFDLPPMIEKAYDTPRNWIKNVQLVDLWARSQKFKTHNIAFFKMPNGDLVVTLRATKYRIPAPDKLGRTVIHGEKMQMQHAIDGLYKHLFENHLDERQIWDLTIAKRWGAYQATPKQKALIARMLRGYKTDGLTKLQASQILNRLLYRGA